MIKRLILCAFGFLLFSQTEAQTTTKYDNLGRLTEVTYPDSSKITYSYDNGGNLLSKTVVSNNPDPCKGLSKPEIIALTPLAVCPGDTVRMTTTNGAGYKWSNGDTTQEIAVIKAGKYAVTRLDTFIRSGQTVQCLTSSDSIEVVHDSSLLKIMSIDILGAPDSKMPIWDSVHFTSEVQNAGLNPNYQWYRNTDSIEAANDNYISGKAGLLFLDGDSICLEVVSNDKCLVNNIARVCTDSINIAFDRGAKIFDYITLYENPNQGEFTVFGHFISERGGSEITIEIYNAIGKQVFQKDLGFLKNTVDAKIDLGNVANGEYFMVIKDRFDERAIKFVIANR